MFHLIVFPWGLSRLVTRGRPDVQDIRTKPQHTNKNTDTNTYTVKGRPNVQTKLNGIHGQFELFHSQNLPLKEGKNIKIVYCQLPCSGGKLPHFQFEGKKKLVSPNF